MSRTEERWPDERPLNKHNISNHRAKHPLGFSKSLQARVYISAPKAGRLKKVNPGQVPGMSVTLKEALRAMVELGLEQALTIPGWVTPQVFIAAADMLRKMGDDKDQNLDDLWGDNSKKKPEVVDGEVIENTPDDDDWGEDWSEEEETGGDSTD
jgi:hypothetical protein